MENYSTDQTSKISLNLNELNGLDSGHTYRAKQDLTNNVLTNKPVGKRP